MSREENIYRYRAKQKKVDTSLKNVYVLTSAFVDGDNIIPVKLEVKEFSDKENTLYVAIALESIKKNEIVKQEVATNGVARQYSPSFTISIAEYFQKINPLDESFVKYIPRQFLEIGIEGEGDSRTDRDGDQRTGTFEEDFSNVRYALPNDPENSDGSSAPFDAEAVIARGVPRTSGRMNITVGELARMEANYTKQKVYSKKDALSVVKMPPPHVFL